jgi:plastocyanin
VITLSACGSATVDAGVHPIISFARGCGTSGGGCGGGGCGSSESSNTNICGWDDGCEDNGGYGSGYGSCWTYDSGCGDYHNESGCSGQSASTAPITPFANISLSDTASVAVKITLTGLNGVTTDADGTLSGKGLTKTGVGTYTLASASAATMTAEMQALVFTPTANQVAPGQTVTTGFDVVATDANGYTDSDATTKVTVTATDSAPTLTQQTLSCTVAEGGTLQGLWSQILANAHDTDVGNQAKLTICSIGQSNTSGFLNYNASSGLLTYTGDDCNPGKTTDSFTYTIADPDGVTCTGTVDIAITGNTVPTTVSTSNNSTLTVSNSNGCFDSFGSNNKLTVSGSGNQVYGGAGANSFTVNGANNTIYTGSSNDTVSLGNTGNTVVLSLGGCDTVSGASLTNGTTFNLDTVLAQCDVQGATLSNISQYFAVACSGSNATLLYDGPGCGSGGSAVAVLNGIGSNTTLASLVSHNMLHV